MRAREIMTGEPRCASTGDDIAAVARLLRDNNCGSLPVVDTTGKLIGIVTDRDLVVRALAANEPADLPVTKVMTVYPFTVSPDDDVRDVEKVMAERQVRRVPVMDADGRCVGIIAQADLARAASAASNPVSDREVALVVERISSEKPARHSDPRLAATLKIPTLGD